MILETPSSGTIRCPACNVALDKETGHLEELSPCPACGALLQIEIFPALNRRIEQGKAAESLLVDDDSSCFYHPTKKAVVCCEGCGRFLCSLCQVELENCNLCPSCLEGGREGDLPRLLHNRHFLHGEVALALSIFPLLFIFPTIVTAPAVLFYVIWFWKDYSGVLSQQRLKMILAFLLASSQVLLWILIITGILLRR